MTHINPLDRFLTPAEAHALSGAASQSVLNWRHHGYLNDVGVFAGNRWLFSVIDVIRLRIINDLAAMGLRIPHAVAIAENADVRAAELSRGAAPAGQVICAWVDGDQLAVRRLKRLDATPRPMIVVPIDDVASDLIRRIPIARMRSEINQRKASRRGDTSGE